MSESQNNSSAPLTACACSCGCANELTDRKEVAGGRCWPCWASAERHGTCERERLHMQPDVAELEAVKALIASKAGRKAMAASAVAQRMDWSVEKARLACEALVDAGEACLDYGGFYYLCARTEQSFGDRMVERAASKGAPGTAWKPRIK